MIFATQFGKFHILIIGLIRGRSIEFWKLRTGCSLVLNIKNHSFRFIAIECSDWCAYNGLNFLMQFGGRRGTIGRMNKSFGATNFPRILAWMCHQISPQSFSAQFRASSHWSPQSHHHLNRTSQGQFPLRSRINRALLSLEMILILNEQVCTIWALIAPKSPVTLKGCQIRGPRERVAAAILDLSKYFPRLCR